MYWHLILTERCNLQCRYCYEKSMKEFDNGLDKKFDFDFSDPADSEVNIENLRKFILQDKEPVIIFYGGEPLIKIDLIKKIIDAFEDKKVKFCMQTNGVLLDKLDIFYLKKISRILVSIDGSKERTELNRGKGNYSKVLENLKNIRRQNYSGEIVARMTIAQDCPDIYKQVLNLVKLIDKKIINSIHWQIDAGFYKEDFDREKISKFFEDYNVSILKLIDWWKEKISEGKIYRLYPLVGIVKPLLEGKKCNLRCGAGYEGYAISTSGKIVACPIMNCIENFKAGNLNSKIKELKKFDCKDECKCCEVYDLCGGRCMYWKKAQLWPKEGDEMICNSIKNYILKIKNLINEIRNLIEQKKIKKSDFDYEDFFGPEIIP